MPFNCADHDNIVQATIADIFGDPSRSKQFTPKTGTLDTVVSKSTARVPQLGNCQKLKVIFEAECAPTSLDACDDTLCTLPLTLNNGGDCVEFEADQCVAKTFSVSEADYDCTGFDIAQSVALKKAGIRKAIFDEINAQFLTAIHAAAGQNQYASTDPSIVTAAASTTLPSAYWTLGTLAPYLGLVADYNFDGCLVGGSKLYSEFYHLQNGCNTDACNPGLDISFDLKNIDTVLGGPGALLVDPSAVAFLNYSKNTATSVAQAVSQQGHDGVSIPLKWRETWSTGNGSSITVDVYYQKQCVDLNNIAHTYHYVARFGTALRPDVCGVAPALAFLCA